MKMPRAWLALVGVLSNIACAHQVAQATYTAGDTMVPTISVGTRVALNPLNGVPVRGQVIVFRWPEPPHKAYVKRVIGIPGDKISINGTEVTLNGAPIARCRMGAFRAIDANGATRDGELWLEALDGASWLVFHSTTDKPLPAGPWTVAPGEVFVLGDSRENAFDSRFWSGGKGGGLPCSFIVGVATGVDVPVLPKGAEALEAAFASCRTTLAR